MNGNPEINAMNDDERRQLEELCRENDAWVLNATIIMNKKIFEFQII